MIAHPGVSSVIVEKKRNTASTTNDAGTTSTFGPTLS